MRRKKIYLSIFLNGKRGIEVLKKISNTKFYQIKLVIISKKFLKEGVKEFLEFNKINFKYFEKNKLAYLKQIHKNIDIGILAGFLHN